MKISRRKFIYSGLFSLTGLALLDAFIFERYFIEVNDFDLNSHLPPADRIKAIQISDLHLKSVQHYHQNLCKKITDLKPDILFFTGDAIDDNRSLNAFNTFLQLLPPSIPKVAILGNWEYWGKVDVDKLRAIYEKCNGTLLINEHKLYSVKNRSIAVSGTDDFVGGSANIELAMPEPIACDYHVVLNHCPQYSEVIPFQIDKNIPIDLILSGHTHGGQVNLLGFIPFLPQGSGKYVSGWYQDQHKNLYVSKGIGTSILPVRFGARAEISVFNF